MSWLLSWVGYGALAVAGAFSLLVLVIVLLLILPDLLPQDVGGVILYGILGGLLFTVAAPLGAIGLLVVVVLRRRRRRRACSAGAPPSEPGCRG